VRLHNLDNDFFAFVFPWGRYLDTDRARCCVSSWRFPTEIPRAKLTGLYITNAWPRPKQLIMVLMKPLCSPSGYVAEGSGENIFMIVDDKLITPPGRMAFWSALPVTP